MSKETPKVSVDYAQNATMVTFASEKILEEADIRAIESSVMPLVEQAPRINLILNFCNVKFLSSAVLGLLIRISKKVYEYDGQLRLCSISPQLIGIFKITRLDKIFEIYEDANRALNSFNAEN